MGIIVRGIAAGIGLARESYGQNKERRQRENSQLVDSNVLEIASTPASEIDEFLSAGKDDKSGGIPQIAPDVKSAVHEHDSTVATSEREGPNTDTDCTTSDDDLPTYQDLVELDEAQDEVTDTQAVSSKGQVTGHGTVPQKDIPHLAERFAQTYLLPSPIEAPLPRLDCSIIIPQRRPNARKRGWMRAYAPVLATKGIDEACFLDFIQTFNVASQANPLLNAINLAAFSALALPPGIGIAVSEALRLAVDTTVELHSRHRTNDFVNKINKEWLHPRGLCCMVVVWKPSASSLVTNVAFDDIAQKEIDTPKEGFLRNFQAGAAVTRGNIRFPDAAPLVFPILDEVANSTDPKAQTWKAKMATSIASTNDYFDRRAQATYAITNPHSGLNKLGVKPQFKSRYSDPSHPAASGSLLGLVTGGAVTLGDPLKRRQRRYDRHHGRMPLGGRLFEKQTADSEATGTRAADVINDWKPSNVIRMMRGKQVLYLAIVDLPTEQELLEAQKIVEQMQWR